MTNVEVELPEDQQIPFSFRLSWIEKNCEHDIDKQIFRYVINSREALRMARVIRELVGHIEDVKAWAEHAGIYLVDGMAGDDPVLARLCKEAFESWNNLSPDTKELLDESPAPSST